MPPQMRVVNIPPKKTKQSNRSGSLPLLVKNIYEPDQKNYEYKKEKRL